jgi:hypothetical protein
MPAEEHLKVLARCYTAAWCSRDPTSLAVFFPANGSPRVNDDDPPPGSSVITEVAVDWTVA